MEQIGDFTISSVDNLVEDSNSYVDIITDRQIEEIINDQINKGKFLGLIGEKCEGEIYLDVDTIIIKSKSCVELGEDWDSDIWEDNDDFIILRDNHTREFGM